MALREYNSFKITEIQIETTESILKGSITQQKVETDKVEVEEFTPGFENDFCDLSFD